MEGVEEIDRSTATMWNTLPAVSHLDMGPSLGLLLNRYFLHFQSDQAPQKSLELL